MTLKSAVSRVRILFLTLTFLMVITSPVFANGNTYSSEIKFPESEKGVRVNLSLNQQPTPGSKLQVNFAYQFSDPEISKIFERKAKQQNNISISSPQNWKTPGATDYVSFHDLVAPYRNVYAITAFRMFCHILKPSAPFDIYDFDKPDVLILRSLPGTIDKSVSEKGISVLGINQVMYGKLINMDENPAFSLPIPKDCGYLSFTTRTIVVLDVEAARPGQTSTTPISFRFAPSERGTGDISETLDLVTVNPGKSCSPFLGAERILNSIKYRCEKSGSQIVWVKLQQSSSEKSATPKSTSKANSKPSPKPTKSSATTFNCSNFVGIALPQYNVGLQTVGSFKSLVVSNPTGCNLKVRIVTTFLSGQQCPVSGIISLARDESVVVSLWASETPGALSAYTVFPQLLTCKNTGREFQNGQVFVNEIVSSS